MTLPAYKPPLLGRLTRVYGQKFFGLAGIALFPAQGWLVRNSGFFLPLRSRPS